jgi:23S rRNA (guanosine2251-2'-O)-methyltransferase
MADPKKGRWVVGVHACVECLRSNPQAVKEIYFQDLAAAKSPTWATLLTKVRVKPAQKSISFFKELSEFGHQNVALFTTHQPERNSQGASSSVVFLDGVEDPHNLGAIVRTAWLMGTEQIFISDKNSVKMTPTACKVASGGAEHVPVEEVHFLSAMKELKKDGYWVYGFSEKATKSLYDVSFSEKVAFVFGSEEKGIRLPIINECDELLSIPQVEAQASYNVSVSVAVALAEFGRQQMVAAKNKIAAD